MRHLNIDIHHYEIDGETILWPVSLILNEHDRIAIVGANGIGKSTLLKILSSEIREFQGTIENIGSLSIGYLEQIHFLDESLTVREDLANAFTEVRTLEARLHVLEEEMVLTGAYEEYTELLERFQAIDGYTYMHTVERVARGIGIFHLLDRTLAEVSGWERTKIALAKVLLSAPDFLLLDEPTNFIDLASIEWLEAYLRDTWKWGYLIVSHDREFLDTTCTSVIEVLGDYGVDSYVGNYSTYVNEKEKRYARAMKLYDEQMLHIETEKTLINRFRAGSRAGFAKSREHALQKIDRVDKPIDHDMIHFSFPLWTRSTEKVIHLEDVFIGRTDPLFYIRDVTLNRGERVGIIGENGVGKSTFMKTILERIPILEWTMTLGKGVEIAYYSQMHEELILDKTILENFHACGFSFSRERIAHILGNYGFTYTDIDIRVHDLSWWERSKLLFALLSQRESNFLVFDEPTNHLDYTSREALEKALLAYEGTLLFISHDRYFVNKVASLLWIVEESELIVSYGNYDDYRYKKEHGISLDMSLFDASGELDLVLEEQLWPTEAKRIREKFGKRRKHK